MSEGVSTAVSCGSEDFSDIVVHIRHIDLVERRDGTKTSQDGDVIMKFFKSLHSPCIVCSTCRQYLTLKAFTKHQHSSNNTDKVSLDLLHAIDCFVCVLMYVSQHVIMLLC